MNNRETFDFVKKHLLTQKAKATISCGVPGCAYRGYNNMKCAVGCLIKDEHYEAGFETFSLVWHRDTWVAASIHAAVKASGCNADYDLLSDLQMVHDSHQVENWPHELDILEKKWFDEVKS